MQPILRLGFALLVAWAPCHAAASALFGDRARHASGGERLLARRIALQRALEHALCDRGEAKELEREQEVPVRCRIETARGGEAVEHLWLVRNA